MTLGQAILVSLSFFLVGLNTFCAFWVYPDPIMVVNIATGATVGVSGWIMGRTKA